MQLRDINSYVECNEYLRRCVSLVSILSKSDYFEFFSTHYLGN